MEYIFRTKILSGDITTIEIPDGSLAVTTEVLVGRYHKPVVVVRYLEPIIKERHSDNEMS